MGYDVTHHPVSVKEIEYFVLMPYSNRSLIKGRIGELTTDPEQVEFLHMTYESLYEECDASNHVSGLELSQLICCVSSFLHPYWYSRNICFSFLVQEGLCENLFKPLSDFTNDPKITKKLRHKKLLIEENYMSSGFIEPGNMALLADTLIPLLQEKARLMKENQLKLQKERRTLMSYVKIIMGNGEVIETPLDKSLNKLEDLMSDDTLSGIIEVLKYCKENSLGMVEASDMVVPAVGSYSANPNNLKASFLSEDK